MDDLAETVLLNMLRGAGLDGLSPMVDDPTKPLVKGFAARDLAEVVGDAKLERAHDERTTISRFAETACATSSSR